MGFTTLFFLCHLIPKLLTRCIFDTDSFLISYLNLKRLFVANLSRIGLILKLPLQDGIGSKREIRSVCYSFNCVTAVFSGYKNVSM